MKTILYVHQVSDVGGGSYCLLNILKEVNKELYTPIVLLKNDGPLVNEINKLGISVYFLKNLSTVPYNKSALTWKNLINFVHLLLSLFKFEKILNELNPDMVYLNNMMLYPYLRVAKKIGLKTLIHIREHWSDGEHKVQRKMAINRILRYSDRIIAINKFSASMLEGRGKSIDIVYDWIDFKDREDPSFSMAKIFGENVNNLRVYLYTGGIQKIKGSLEILLSFTKNLRSPNERLLFLGVDRNSIEDKFNVKLGRLLSKIGYKTYTIKVLDAMLKDTRIKCIPSTYQIKPIISQSYCLLSFFTQPHANLAMAESIILQTPVIAARTPESLEYSDDGNLAILFAINDKNDFAEKMKCFDDQRLLLLKRLKDHYVVIEQLFSKERNVKLLNSVYSKILS